MRKIIFTIALLFMVPHLAHAQYLHASFFNGGTTLTATCTNVSGSITSSDSFTGTLQGNTTVTLPAAASTCVNFDIVDLTATQGTSSSFTLTVNAGTGNVIKVLSNAGNIIAMPTAGAVSSVVLHQIWIYNSVAATPQWELVTQETNPATIPATTTAIQTGVCGRFTNFTPNTNTDNTITDCNIGVLPASPHGQWLIQVNATELLSMNNGVASPNNFVAWVETRETNASGTLEGVGSVTDDLVPWGVSTIAEMQQHIFRQATFNDGDNPDLTLHCNPNGQTGLTVDGGNGGAGNADWHTAMFWTAIPL